MWRSLVARTLGVGEAPSSNLGIPIPKSALNFAKLRALLFLRSLPDDFRSLVLYVHDNDLGTECFMHGALVRDLL